jgi:hypothetical protein
MILDDDDRDATGPTLDDLFRRAGVRDPQAVALVDPPNRGDFTDGAPRLLSYAQADRAISALAARLQSLGLRTDAVVAVQLANTVESVITLLGVLRAGMIAAPLPLLWRQHDIVAALRGLGAKAIVTCARAGGERPVQSAVLAAAELFPIRHVCAFGDGLPDGVVPLDDVFSTPDAFVSAPVREGPAAAHVAVVTFEVTPSGVTALARNAAQLAAGGVAVSLEAGLGRGTTVLSTIPPSSFAGIAVAVMPWLLGGGRLVLHHGCDPAVLDAQGDTLSSAALVLPGPALVPLADSGRLLAFGSIIGLWRAPERLAVAAAWRRRAPLTDVAVFGEIGLIPGKRGADGKPVPIPLGPIGTLRQSTASCLAECLRTRAGTLAMRGAMVATRGFPPRRQAKLDEGVDTGFTCALENGSLVVTGPPPGTTSVGGYRFADQAVEALLAATDTMATLMAVPDGLLGQHWAGQAADPAAVCFALRSRGANPLVVEAFERSSRAGTGPP